MRVSLVFPPYFISYQPYSSLPILAACLREKGHSVQMADENIGFIRHYLRAEYFREIYGNICTFMDHLRRKKEKSKNELILEKFIIKCFQNVYFHTILRGLESSIEILTDRTLIANEYKANMARDIVNKAQNLLNQYIRFHQILNNKNEDLTYNLKWDHIENEFRSENLYRKYFGEQSIPAIAEYKPDILGVSIIFEEQLIPAFILANEVRKNPTLQDIHITFGGPVITILKEQIRENDQFFSIIDTCIIYEGEEALLKLLYNMETSSGYDDVPNLIYMRNGQVVENQVVMISGLNGQPTPDFEGLRLDSYFSPNLVPVLKPTRGCYWNRCSFCNNRYLNNYTTYRFRDPERVFHDFVTLYEEFGVEEFTLWEEAAVPKCLKRLAELISESDYDFKWFAEARLDRIYTEDLFKTLYQGGCRGMVFGVESGSKRIQKLMNKGYDLDVCRDVIRNCSKAKIRVYITLMVGFPSETPQEVLDTIEFVSENSRYIFHAGVSHFGLRKYTETYDNPDKFGITIEKNDFLSSIGDLNYGVSSKGMTLEESMSFYNLISRKLVELGLARNEPECHFLIRTNEPRSF